MSSTYTTRLRLNKQATGENTNTWGALLNTGALDLIDAGMDGLVTISTGGATTLTTANGTDDQARKRILNITASTAAAITIPSVEKWYLVRNASSSVSHTITNGSSSVTIYPNEVVLVLTDGTTLWNFNWTNMRAQRLQNLSAPTQNTDAATKKYVDDTAFAAAELPGQTGNSGKFVTTDGSNASWGYPLGGGPMTIVTSATTAVSGDRLACDTTSAAFAVDLPASPADKARVEVFDAGASASFGGFQTNNLTVNRNGSTILGVSDNYLISKKGARRVFEYSASAGTWKVHQ